MRKTLESWHTAMTTEADNNARTILYSFKIIFFIYQIIFLVTLLRIIIFRHKHNHKHNHKKIFNHFLMIMIMSIIKK